MIRRSKGKLGKGLPACHVGVSHHTALNHRRNSFLAHLCNQGSDSDRGEITKKEKGTPA